MWIILKYDKKNFNNLKNELIKKTDSNLKIYFPKILLNKINRGKNFKKEINIMGDYIFCFHQKFNEKKFILTVKYLIGIKYILDGYFESQREICKFIESFKKLENNEGFISKNFYSINLEKEYRFLSGPFVSKIFKIIELQKNKIKILIDKLKIDIKKEDYFFKPVN